VSIAKLHAAVQVSYMIMMYISVFPVAISLRRTNVYEEKSLGIYAQGEEEDDDAQDAPSYIGTHLRRQLSFDLWYVFLGLFIIAIVEGDHINDKSEYAFQLFNVLFEIVSAYGTVGMSMGYPGINASFSAKFRVISKLIIIAMYIRGRHRGLPYALDRAILLPSESLHAKEMADAEKRMRRRNSNLSGVPSMSRQQSQPPEAGASTGLDTQGKDKQTTGMNGDGIIRRQSTLRSQR
jgi:Trk-type K+ transport system membrane component